MLRLLPLFIFIVLREVGGDPLSLRGHQQAAINQCTTPRCNEISNRIFGMLNTSADACEEPHLYLCGNWMESFALPKDESSWSASFATVRNNTREHLRQILEKKTCPDFTIKGKQDQYDDMLSCLYQTCMDTDSLNDLKARSLISEMKSKTPFLLERVMTPEKIDDEAKLDTAKKVQLLSSRVAELLGLGVTGWFGLAVDPSVLSESGNYQLYLSEGGLALQYRQYDQSDAVDAYLDYISKLLAAFTTEARGLNDETDEIKEESKKRASAVLKMEQDIKKISFTPEQQRDPQLTINLRTYDAVRTELSGALNLDIVLKPLLSLATDATEEDKSHFIVDNPSFMGNLTRLIQTKWTWGAVHDYLLIRTLRSFASGLSKEYRDIVDEFQTRMLGSTPPPRWRRCQVSVANDLGWILSLRYVNSIEKPERRKEIAEDMVKSLKETYADVIKNVKWMDEKTKKIALRKLKATTHKLAFPDWLQSDHKTYFMRYYGKPDVTIMRDFVKASIHISDEQTRFRMSRLGAPKDTTEWEMYPQEVNAYFNPVQNEIVFPLSIMQEPFSYVWTECNNSHAEAEMNKKECSTPDEKAFMQLLTFGGLGSVVGHELTHGFDDQGRQFGEKGQLVDWWSDNSAKAFDKAAQCISKQYGGYALKLHRPTRNGNHQEWKLEEVSVSGKLTLGENIADNGGIKLAYLALQRLHPEYFTTQIVAKPLSDVGFTSAGLFSASFGQLWCDVSREKALLQRISGDPHSPNPFRIIGTLTNFKTYSDAFECRAGSKVNPSSSKHQAVSVVEEDDEFEGLRRYMLEKPSSVMESDFDTIVFDPLNGVVAPNPKSRCEVW